MLNITGKFIKIWVVEVKEKFVKVDMSSSKKNQDGTYTNSSWKGCKFVGKAFESAKSLGKGDTIHVLSGMMGKREYQGKWYDDIVIFEFEEYKKSEQSQSEVTGFEQVQGEDNLPF